MWIAGSLGCLLVLAWLGLAGYVTARKQTIIQKARTELRDRLGGEATIGDMEVSFFHHFPAITLHLSKVTLRDSLWQQHRHDLLDAEDMYLRLALFKSILSGTARLEKVYIERGSIYLFTDSTGYSNTAALTNPEKKDASRPTEEAQPPDLSLRETRLVMENQDRHKFFDLEFRQLDCSISKQGRTLSLRTHADALVKSLAFNTEKGSFIKDKDLSGDFTLQFNTGSKILQFNRALVHIDKHPFVMSGRFFPDVKPDPFFLSIHTENIPYRKATALLTPLIRQKLDPYDIDKPVTIQASLDAGNADDPTPLITVQMDLQDVSVNTPPGRFNHVRTKARFVNEWVRHEKRRDENSAIVLTSFTGEFMGIPLHSDSAVVTDLKHPIMDCDVHTSFDLARLNDLLGSRSLQFRKGGCSVDLHYRGPLKEDDSASVSLYGGLTIDSATVNYLPYNFQLTNGKGKIRFKDQDLVFERLEARAGNSKIGLKGIVRNIARLIDQNPNNTGMDFTLSSPRLDLEDLAPVLGRQTPEATLRRGSKPLFGETASRLDQLLRDGAIHLKIDATELRYQRFSGVRAQAELLFQNSEVQLKKMELTLDGVRPQADGGTITLSGTLKRQPGGGGNPLSFRSHLEQVDIPGLFTAFDNFGQDALKDKNLKGKLTAEIEMTGRLTDKARMVKNSLKGSINFTLKGGQLINFEPMEKIHETVLKKRDLSEIHFAELKNQLDLDTSTLTIHRMEIQSTAFSLFVEGTYDLRTGPDLSLQVPLSNLKKDRNVVVPPESKGNDGKAGLSLRLRVRKGDDGKMKISWDPFRKALKKMSGKK